MNYDEGKIKVYSKPVITIADTPLDKCKLHQIEREILFLLKRVETLRAEVQHLAQFKPGRADVSK